MLKTILVFLFLSLAVNLTKGGDCTYLNSDCSNTNTLEVTTWWLYNSKWLIAVIVVGSIGTVVTIIIACVCCCIKSNRHRTTAVVVPGGNVMAMSQTNQMSQNQGAQYPPGNYGNPPPQYPGPQYPSGSYGQQPPPVNGTYPEKPLPKY